MSVYNKVVWSEGLFLKPHHLQQNDRYLEHLSLGRWASSHAYGWGFTEFAINRDMLKLGKIAIASASGVMEDGTPFSIPDEADHPPPFEPPASMRNSLVYLALPVYQPGVIEIAGKSAADIPVRYAMAEEDIVDNLAGEREAASVEIGRLKFQILPEEADRSGFSCIAIGRVVETRGDHQVVLDATHVPPMLDCAANAQLSDYIAEVQGMLHHRGEALAARIGQSGARGVAEIADYLLLLSINRNEPLFKHYKSAARLHPELLYREMVQLAGELSTYSRNDKRPVSLGTYHHGDLNQTFRPVMQAIRDSLRAVLEQTALQLPLRQHKYGVQVAEAADRSLFENATFVLAVRADVETERLRRGFPSHIKIGPAAKIKDLVNAAIPGIVINALPVAPRQIPFHVGVVYFEIDQQSPYWKEVSQSGALAMHVAGDFPNLEMALWAIRGS
ncbi:type VI secretion system baseplate subunit TssK [Pararhizobium arenae]|uniref:type VI secretion system baseplate subunit TssK n=1 Tax=Pararhizobium arenae TaxID=1856850 RepID=UPI00094B18C8|nr:type VI secretion system baseplate subunit TssK [Pararhizobium arenae]